MSTSAPSKIMQVRVDECELKGPAAARSPDRQRMMELGRIATRARDMERHATERHDRRY